jgi:hypothetical protein
MPTGAYLLAEEEYRDSLELIAADSGGIVITVKITAQIEVDERDRISADERGYY